MRTAVFARRNLIEIFREPISYIFGLGLPVVMLVVMTVINNAIPPGVMTIFNIENLSCGIAVFSLTFTMLSAALLVSRDRTGAFLTRLYTSPMRAHEFVLGYALPLLLVAVCQLVITFFCSGIVSLFVKGDFTFAGAMLAMLSLLPAALMFVFFGVAFGFLFSEKSAPPVCSMIITLSGLLGGIWFDCTIVGGFIEGLCRALPFFNATLLSRAAMMCSFEVVPFVASVLYTAVAGVFSCVAFVVCRNK